MTERRSRRGFLKSVAAGATLAAAGGVALAADDVKSGRRPSRVRRIFCLEPKTRYVWYGVPSDDLPNPHQTIVSMRLAAITRIESDSEAGKCDTRLVVYRGPEPHPERIELHVIMERIDRQADPGDVIEVVLPKGTAEALGIA